MRLTYAAKVVIVGLAAAAWPFAATASLISQGYAVTSPVPIGALVSVATGKAGTVEIATLKNQDRLFGITVVASSSLITITGGSGQVQVATAGQANALVSTENGAIKRGDHLTVSSIAGVAQKATANSRTVGTASDDFDDRSTGAQKRQIETPTGKKEVAIGQIPVDIVVGNYLSSNSDVNSVVPTWLQSSANVVAGKSVSPVRAIIATTILMAAIISVSVLLYGAVRTSIISIGRNPLAKSSVFRGLAQVLVIVLMILCIAAALSYVVVTQ